MTFRIELFDRWPGFRINRGPANYGRITYGAGPADWETFVAPTDVKSAGWYRRQWDTALRRLLAGPCESSLVVSAGDPTVDFIQVWDLWNVGTPVALMQNRMHIPEASGVPASEGLFVIDRPWESAGEPYDGTGQRVSQWQVPLASVEDFMRDGGPLGAKPGNKVWGPGHQRRVKN